MTTKKGLAYDLFGSLIFIEALINLTIMDHVLLGVESLSNYPSLLD